MEDDSIVISGRVRLARNLAGVPFPSKLDSERSLSVTQSVFSSLRKSVGNYTITRISDMSELDAEVLKEQHMISDDLLHGNKYAAAIINEAKDVCIMVNEEDHIREQCFVDGNNLKAAYDKINEVDDIISETNKFAYDARLGYLTACPTNVGTGLRASALMFLPGLSITRSLEGCVNAVSRLDMTVRGEYGEGSGSEGYLYQLSNQKTLGVTEDEIISSVTATVEQIAQQEIIARKALLEDNPITLRDRIMRAYGILTNAYSVSGKEFMEKLAFVKLGVYYKFLNCSDINKLNKLTIGCQPANLIASANKSLSVEERDVYRAMQASKELKSIIK